MYTLTLTSEQLKVLDIALECAVDQIHNEILHTDNRCYRVKLKDGRYILQELLNGVRRSPAIRLAARKRWPVRNGFGDRRRTAAAGFA